MGDASVATLASGGQHQWWNLVPSRRYVYTHSQPQWADVLSDGGSHDLDGKSYESAIVRREPLISERTCSVCHFVKDTCSCTRCRVCACRVIRGNRHHCRKCWDPVCSACWVRDQHVNLLGEPVRVCDRCAVPWATAVVTTRREEPLRWGLYVLRRAVVMPRMCVTPSCATFTYRSECYVCQTTTVATRPHEVRFLRLSLFQRHGVSQIHVLDRVHKTRRLQQVQQYTSSDVERVFRNCFPLFEETRAFRGVDCSRQAQDILFSMIASAVAYEYHSAPSLSLALSDVPYAMLLSIVAAKPRYTILEAPGKVKFVAFPGTHNWRTTLVGLTVSQVTQTVWAELVNGVSLNSEGQAITINGGVHKVWEYKVHGGFLHEALEVGIPVESLIEDVRNGYRLVFCGHSLGGAVAQLVTIELLSRYSETLAPPGRKDSRILCTSFGSPLVGNYQLADRVERSNWSHLFHNFVYHTDVVPRLACGDEYTWDATAQLVGSLSAAYHSVQEWWSGGGSANREDACVATMEEEANSTVTREEEQCVLSLESMLNSSVPSGHDGLTAGEQVTSEEGLTKQDASQVSTMSPPVNAIMGNYSSLSSFLKKVPEDANDVMLAAEPVQLVRASNILATDRRVQRSYACFGWYHFLGYGRSGYVHAIQSEDAFRTLKCGCGDTATLTDHTITSYQRGLMLHLYGCGSALSGTESR